MVAPGIAEALIATALGLAAAIPAVVAYNQISVSLGRAFARGSSAVTDIARESIVSGSRSDARRLRGGSVEPIRMGKHP